MPAGSVKEITGRKYGKIFISICCWGLTCDAICGLRPWIWRCWYQAVTPISAMSTRYGRAWTMPSDRRLDAEVARSSPKDFISRTTLRSL